MEATAQNDQRICDLAITKNTVTRLHSMVHHRKYPLLILPKHLQSLKFLTASNRLGGDAFARKYIISLLTLTLGQGQT